MAGVGVLLKIAADKQKETDVYLKSADTMFDEGGRKLGEIFREDNWLGIAPVPEVTRWT